MNPRSFETLIQDGLVKFNKGDKKGALADFKLASELNPNNFLPHYNCGVIKSVLGRTEDSLECYTKSIKLNSSFFEAYNNRGIIKARLGHKQDAILDYSKALEIRPKYSLAYFNRGNANLTLKDYRDAIDDYSKSIAFHKRESNFSISAAYYNRGIARFEPIIEKLEPSFYSDLDKKLTQFYTRFEDRNNEIIIINYAKSDFLSSIEINPNFAFAYNNLGVTYSALQSREDAIRSYATAIELKKDLAEAYYNRGISKLVLNDRHNHFNLLIEKGQSFDSLTLKEPDCIKAIELKSDIEGELVNPAKNREKLKRNNGLLENKKTTFKDMFLQNKEYFLQTASASLNKKLLIRNYIGILSTASVDIQESCKNFNESFLGKLFNR